MSIDFQPVATRELTDLLADIEVRNRSAFESLEQSVGETLELLNANPLLGTAYRSRNPALAGIRYFLVPDYPQFVIIYRPIPEGIEVMHILRGRRNLRAILEGDE
jgi:plasmid stabilization system protein ParE